jgi:hypothetical protein
LSKFAKDIGKMSEGLNQVKIVIAGGSNAAKVAAECKGPGISVESIAVPGWRLAADTVKSWLTASRNLRKIPFSCSTESEMLALSRLTMSHNRSTADPSSLLAWLRDNKCSWPPVSIG